MVVVRGSGTGRADKELHTGDTAVKSVTVVYAILDYGIAVQMDGLFLIIGGVDHKVCVGVRAVRVDNNGFVYLVVNDGCHVIRFVGREDVVAGKGIRGRICLLMLGHFTRGYVVAVAREVGDDDGSAIGVVCQIVMDQKVICQGLVALHIHADLVGGEHIAVYRQGMDLTLEIASVVVLHIAAQGKGSESRRVIGSYIGCHGLLQLAVDVTANAVVCRINDEGKMQPLTGLYLALIKDELRPAGDMHRGDAFFRHFELNKACGGIGAIAQDHAALCVLGQVDPRFKGHRQGRRDLCSVVTLARLKAHTDLCHIVFVRHGIAEAVEEAKVCDVNGFACGNVVLQTVAVAVFGGKHVKAQLVDVGKIEVCPVYDLVCIKEGKMPLAVTNDTLSDGVVPGQARGGDEELDIRILHLCFGAVFDGNKALGLDRIGVSGHFQVEIRIVAGGGIGVVRSITLDVLQIVARSEDHLRGKENAGIVIIYRHGGQIITVCTAVENVLDLRRSCVSRQIIGNQETIRIGGCSLHVGGDLCVGTCVGVHGQGAERTREELQIRHTGLCIRSHVTAQDHRIGGDGDFDFANILGLNQLAVDVAEDLVMPRHRIVEGKG